MDSKMSEEKSFSVEDFAIGLVSGVLAGAAIAVLFAPSSGSRTRQRIQKWATDTKLSTTEVFEKARHALDKVLQKAEGVLGWQEKGLRKKLQQIKSELESFDLSKS